MDHALAEARFKTVVLGLFALVAFMLAAVGIYGLISYDVTARTRELGIRMALGAESLDILRLVVGQGARLAAYGIRGAGRRVRVHAPDGADVVWRASARTPTPSPPSPLLGAVALVASYLPSRRAMALDAVTALRHE